MFEFKKNRYQILENDRKPVVAGRFYPSTAKELRSELAEIITESPNFVINDPLQAIIVPHAGYTFSGSVAGSAYKALKKFAPPSNVFIIGTSHQMQFAGASIYNKGDYITPLGKVKVNRNIANQLFQDNDAISFNPAVHSTEHTIEVQLPFLQYIYGNQLQIIPIIIGTSSQKVCKSIAQSLRPYFKKENLFVISSDFSHYPEYRDALKIDGFIAKTLLKNDPTLLKKNLQKIKNEHIENLSTAICGFSSLITLQYLTHNGPFAYKLFKYANSGDHPYFGDKSRVVGYWSLGVTNTNKKYKLSNSDRDTLLNLAHRSLQHHFLKIASYTLKDKDISDSLKEKLGAFVSVYVNGKLRGCIGRFNSKLPLYSYIPQMTISAALSDTRFDPLNENELNDVEIEISVLSPLDKVSDIREINVGQHGIYIKKESHSGTFLPQVANNKNWTREEFLGYCSRDKANLGWLGWQKAEIYKYEAIVFRSTFKDSLM